MASGWIVGQMSGTAAFPSSSLLARWLRVLFDAATVFFRFCVGWLSIIFGTLRNNRRPNERERREQRTPPSLVGRLAKSPPCLHAFPSSMIGLLYIEGNERIARGGWGGVASGPRYRHDDGVIITLAFRRHS